MLDVKQVIDKMYERGFTETMRSVKNGHEPISINFCTMKLDGKDISCEVNLEKETFNFIWCIPKSINRIVSPDCGSLFNDEHFHRLYRTTLKQVRLLYNEFGD